MSRYHKILRNLDMSKKRFNGEQNKEIKAEVNYMSTNLE